VHESRTFRRAARGRAMDRKVDRSVDPQRKQDIGSRQTRQTDVEACRFRRFHISREVWECGIQRCRLCRIHRQDDGSSWRDGSIRERRAPKGAVFDQLNPTA